MTMELFFYLFASMVVLGSIGVVLFRNPVYAALSLMFTFLNSAGLLLLLYNEFLAMIVVIVYVGAVATLFLFVVMMLKIQPRLGPGYLYSLACLAVTFAAFFIILYKGSFEYIPPAALEEIPLKSLAMVLYVDYADYLQIMGVLLLLAMVGCILLVEQIRLESDTFVRHQSMSKQVARNPRDCVSIVPKKKNGGGV